MQSTVRNINRCDCVSSKEMQKSEQESAEGTETVTTQQNMKGSGNSWRAQGAGRLVPP